MVAHSFLSANQSFVYREPTERVVVVMFSSDFPRQTNLFFEDLQVGRRPPRQARRSHHVAVDGRCRRKLWLGPQRTRKNDHQKTSSGWRQAKGQLAGNEEDGAGELPGRGDFVAHDIGSTFFGDQGRSIRNDHVVVPQAALGLVCSCRTLTMAGCSRSARERREHIPVAIEIEVPLRCQPLPDPRIRARQVGAHATRHQGNK